MNRIVLPGDIGRICVMDPGNPVARFAAKELQRCLRRVARVNLPIVHLDRDLPQEAAFLLSIRGNAEEDRFDLVADSGRRMIRIAGDNPRSLLFGVYAFAKDYLGMRWLCPGAGGELFAKRERVEVPTGLRTERAFLKYRGFYIDTCQFSVNRENIADIVDWMAKNFANYILVSVEFYEELKAPLLESLRERGLILELGHHGFDSYMRSRENFPRHPEWFSMIRGKRDPGRRTPFRLVIDGQICGSNQRALDYYADALKRTLDENPRVDVLGIMPNDGFGWCECPKCRKLVRDDRVSPLREPSPGSDRSLKMAGGRYHHIVSEVARRLGPAYSGKRFSFCAYAGEIFPTPEIKDLPPNFMCMLAPYERGYDFALNDRRARKIPGHANPMLTEIFQQWRSEYPWEIYVYEYYAKYAWYSLPKWIPDVIRTDTRFLAREGFQGVISMCETDNFRLYEPNHHSQLAMCWDGSLRPEQWLRDYTSAAFKSMAVPARRAIRSVISVMRPYATILGRPYPRRLTPRAIRTLYHLRERFAALAVHGRRKKVIPAASVQRLAVWSKNMELTRQRFVLNGIYHEMEEALENKRYVEALEVHRRWSAAKRAFWETYTSLRGTGAVLSDRRWVGGAAAFMRPETRMRRALRSAVSGRAALDPAALLDGMRPYAC